MNELSEKIFPGMRKTFVRYRTLLNVINICITGMVYVAYPTFLIYVFLNNRDLFVPVVAVPGSGFIILSVFRYLWNAPRPYEVYGVDPIISKKTKGKSFPSRHVFSVFVIAMAVLRLWPVTGAALCVCGLILAAVRVITGVHFVKDVVIATISGIIYSIVGYYGYSLVFGGGLIWA